MSRRTSRGWLGVVTAILVALGAAPVLAGPAKPRAALVAEMKSIDDSLPEAFERGRYPMVIPLLELWENWDSSTPQKLQAELARLAVHPAVPAARKVLVETMLAQARLRRGDVNAVAGRFEELGAGHDYWNDSHLQNDCQSP